MWITQMLDDRCYFPRFSEAAPFLPDLNINSPVFSVCLFFLSLFLFFSFFFFLNRSDLFWVCILKGYFNRNAWMNFERIALWNLLRIESIPLKFKTGPCFFIPSFLHSLSFNFIVSMRWSRNEKETTRRILISSCKIV